MKNSYFVLIAVIILIYVVFIVRKGHLSIKESFWWFIGSIVVLFLAIFPKSIDVIAEWFGVAYPPTLMLVFCILFLLMMNFRVSKRISDLQMKVMELGQELSILRNDKRK